MRRSALSHATTLSARALRAEHVLASLAPPAALPWDAQPLLLQRPSAPPPLPPPRAPSHTATLCSLADGGQHAEAGVLLLACHGAGLPADFGTAATLLVSAARGGGLVLSAGEVAALVGLGRSAELPEGTLLRMLEGHCAQGAFAEALGLAAELQRAESPLAQRAQHVVLEAAAARRRAGAAAAAAAAAALPPSPSLSELTVRALLDPALPQHVVRVYSSTLDGLLQSPGSLHDGALVRSLWAACTALQAAAARQAPLAPSALSFLLSAALVSGDVQTLRSVLVHTCACSSGSSSSVTLPRLLLLRCAASFLESSQWQDALDTLQLAARSGAGAEGLGAPGAPLFAAAGGALHASAAAAAAVQLPAMASPLETPLWRLCFRDQGAAGLEQQQAEALAVSDAGLPPSSLDGVPEELLLSELSIQALSRLGRHEAALQLWERERVQQRLLEFLEPPPPPAGAAAAPGAAAPPASHASAAGECLPHLIASHLALGRAEALEPILDALLTTRPLLPLASRPALLKGYADYIVTVAPSRASPDALMRQLLTACPEDASRQVTACLLEAALKLYEPTSRPLLLVDTGRLSGAWAAEEEGAGTLDLHFSLQSAAVALERTRFQSLLAILSAMQARGITLPEDAPHAAALYALKLQASVGDSPEQLQAAVQQWMAAHPLHMCTSLLTSAVAVLKAVSKSCTSLGSLPQQAAGAASAAEPAAPPPAPAASPTPAFVYQALVTVSQSLADAVVASLGKASAQSLTPLERSLRLVTLDVLDVAQAHRHERLLVQGSGGGASPLQQMLSCVLQPLKRQVEGGSAGASSSSSSSSSSTKGVRSLSVSPNSLLHAGGKMLGVLVQEAREDLALLEGWSSRDIEDFLLCTQRVNANSERQSTVPATLRLLLELHSSASSAGGSSHHLHPLHVSYPAFSSLATHLASTGAAWTLARALCAVTLHETPALAPGAGAGAGAAAAPAATAVTTSAIFVPEAVAQAAVLADTYVQLVESARSRGYDATLLADKLGYWLRALNQRGRSDSKTAQLPWTALLRGVSSGSGSASVASSLPSIALMRSGRVLRSLPPPLTAEAVPYALDGSAQRPASEEGGQLTSIFGDAVVPLHEQEQQEFGEGRAGGRFSSGSQAAVVIPTLALARVVRVAAALDGSSPSRLPQQLEQQPEPSPLPILVRELLRLGVWVDGPVLDALSEAAVADPSLLLPLLQHLRAQAVATLQVLPGIHNGPLLATLLPFVPVCGLGASAVVRARLVTAAVKAGALRLALELLQEGPHHLLMPAATSLGLVRLAHKAGERAVVERLATLFPAAAAAVQLPPLGEALPAPAPPRTLLAAPTRQPANFFAEHLDSLTAKWLQASSTLGVGRGGGGGSSTSSSSSRV